MKSLLPLLTLLLLAACTTSPTVSSIPTFTGNYIDARKEVTAKPVSVHREPLHVPLYHRKDDLDASAVVAFMVEADGRTSEIQIVRASDWEFAQAVRNSVAGWRYAPPLRDGQPVPTSVRRSRSARSVASCAAAHS